MQLSQPLQPGSALPTPRSTNALDLRSLVEAITQRHKRSLADLYDRTRSTIYAKAHSVLRSKQDAEEIVGDVFMYVWDHAHLYDPERGGGHGWLTVITRNCAIDLIRKRRHDLSIDEEAWYEAERFTFDCKGPEFLTGHRSVQTALHIFRPDRYKRAGPRTCWGRTAKKVDLESWKSSHSPFTVVCHIV